MSVSYPTKIHLALLSGNRCAMPSCGRLLLKRDADNKNNDFCGEAAHIAGEHGGKHGSRPSPRFDETMTPEERNSISNLLYLCCNCHTVIDAHPYGERNYPVERLHSIKKEHEARMAAAIEEDLTSVTFQELEEAIQWVNTVTPSTSDEDFHRIPIKDKIKKNGLSVSSENLIRTLVVATPQVRSFIQSLSQNDPLFPGRLKSGFLQHYHMLIQGGTSAGEELFTSMCMFARRGIKDGKGQFAALAVLVYLFEICDVFEK